MMTLYDDDMRTIIDIPDSLLKEVDALAEREQISRAETVRRAMTEYLAKRSTSRPDAAFGIWKSKHIDPLDYEDSLRGEWNR
jgi:metal-responsive CopG/Arc/MetJ family transcriptional regulator